MGVELCAGTKRRPEAWMIRRPGCLAYVARKARRSVSARRGVIERAEWKDSVEEEGEGPA